MVFLAIYAQLSNVLTDDAPMYKDRPENTTGYNSPPCPAWVSGIPFRAFVALSIYPSTNRFGPRISEMLIRMPRSYRHYQSGMFKADESTGKELESDMYSALIFQILFIFP